MLQPDIPCYLSGAIRRKHDILRSVQKYSVCQTIFYIFHFLSTAAPISEKVH